MAKLRLFEKDYIVDHIVDDLKNQIKEKREKLEQDFQQIIEDLLPQEISEFKKKYPKWIRRNPIYYGDLPNFVRAISNFCIYFHIYTYGDMEIKPEVFDNNSIRAQVDILVSLCKKKKEIENKTKCALEYINTDKQLKNQFPEAYNILTNRPVEQKENQCDSIESLRAELSSIKNS